MISDGIRLDLDPRGAPGEERSTMRVVLIALSIAFALAAVFAAITTTKQISANHASAAYRTS